MKKLTTFLFAALLYVAPAFAQMSGGGMFPGPGTVHSTGAAYTGVGDVASIPTVVAAYGAHCFKSSYSGNILDVYSLTNLTVMATLTCSTGGIIGATGTWSLAQVRANCTITHDCYAVKLYDQSGALFCSGSTACDTVLGNVTNSPWLITADGTTTCGSGSTFANANTFCLNTLNVGGTTAIVSAALGSAIAQPITYVFTYATQSVGNQAFILYNGTATTVIGASDTSAATLASYAGGSVATVTASEAQWHTAQMTLNGASSYLQIDNGTPNTATNPGTATISSGDTININNGSAQNFLGFLGDIYVFRATSISTAAAAVYANEKAFWGGGMP